MDEENNEEDLNKKEFQILERWSNKQKFLIQQLITKDDFDVGNIQLIGGVDISFNKENPTEAISSLVIMTYPGLKVVKEIWMKVNIVEPYKSGFLAFREVNHLVRLVDKLKKEDPLNIPDLILVDGSGIYHPRGFGLASHFGVLVDLPTIGVAKNLIEMDGIDQQYVEKLIETNMMGKNTNKVQYLVGKSQKIHGAIFKLPSNKRPIFVSIGHRISLESALKVIEKCCLHKNPLPIKMADMLSRKHVKELYRNNDFVNPNKNEEGKQDDEKKKAGLIPIN